MTETCWICKSVYAFEELYIAHVFGEDSDSVTSFWVCDRCLP